MRRRHVIGGGKFLNGSPSHILAGGDLRDPPVRAKNLMDVNVPTMTLPLSVLGQG